MQQHGGSRARGTLSPRMFCKSSYLCRPPICVHREPTCSWRRVGVGGPVRMVPTPRAQDPGVWPPGRAPSGMSREDSTGLHLNTGRRNRPATQNLHSGKGASGSAWPLGCPQTQGPISLSSKIQIPHQVTSGESLCVLLTMLENLLSQGPHPAGDREMHRNGNSARELRKQQLLNENV